MSGTPSWEVFVRARRGVTHTHVGTVKAADGELALQRARDLFTRRGEGVSIWVVPSTAIVASSPEDAAALFDPALDKEYRQSTYYDVPKEVSYL